MSSIVGLIPARSGSKRVPHKNIRMLGGHPLLAWSIVTALESGIFDAVAVSTDSEEYADISRTYGATVVDRPAAFGTDTSPDIQWVQHAMAHYQTDAFAILRPTSPFRTADTIKRAWGEFQKCGAHSLRAVEKTRVHPGKLWTVQQTGMISAVWPRIYETGNMSVPYHSMPTQYLPEVLQQNASLEMAWVKTSVGARPSTISGDRVWPFYTHKWEGFDINVPEDCIVAEHLVATRQVAIPEGLNVHQAVGLSKPQDSDAGGDGSGAHVAGALVQEGAVDAGVRGPRKARRVVH